MPVCRALLDSFGCVRHSLRTEARFIEPSAAQPALWVPTEFTARAITAVDGAPVSFASRYLMVPVTEALVTPMTTLRGLWRVLSPCHNAQDQYEQNQKSLHQNNPLGAVRALSPAVTARLCAKLQPTEFHRLRTSIGKPCHWLFLWLAFPGS